MSGYRDDGHLLPAAVWEKVVQDADTIAGQHRAPREAADPGAITGAIPALAHGGIMSRPTLIVVHDAETPLKAGYARSIAMNWFGTAAAGTSAHAMADPIDLIQMLPDNVVSWAVGPNANSFTLNIEQAGYGSFNRAQWTTPAGLAQFPRVGGWIRNRAKAHNIPLRWATDAQIRDAARGIPGGVCHHDDIRRVLGGTTHTDPGPAFPNDLVQKYWIPQQEDPLAALTDTQAAKLASNVQFLVDNLSAIGDVASNVSDASKRDVHTAAFYLGYAKFYAQANHDLLTQLTAHVAALQATVAKLAAPGGSALTAAQLQAVAQQAAESALQNLGKVLQTSETGT
jgi:hypothetical protein